jgi:ornithine cyclodeaminase/alanine dehydrogenase-like protein (mu-crystallin family)
MKVVSVFPANKEKELPVVLGYITLIEATTGRLLALMEGTYLTALRTGAAGGIACRWLAREDSKTIAIIGTGVQGRTQLAAAKVIRNIREAYIYDLNQEQAEGYLEWASTTFPEVMVKISPSAEEAVEKADILVTTTTSSKPVFDARALKAGAHINAVGSFKPQMQEIPEAVVLEASKVAVDSLEAAMEEAGDIIIPINRGNYSTERIYAEIGEIAGKKKPGRENDSELTLFKTVGIAVQDVAVASLVYQRAREKGLGQEVDI